MCLRPRAFLQDLIMCVPRGKHVSSRQDTSGGRLGFGFAFKMCEMRKKNKTNVFVFRSLAPKLSLYCLVLGCVQSVLGCLAPVGGCLAPVSCLSCAVLGSLGLSVLWIMLKCPTSQKPEKSNSFYRFWAPKFKQSGLVLGKAWNRENLKKPTVL